MLGDGLRRDDRYRAGRSTTRRAGTIAPTPSIGRDEAELVIGGEPAREASSAKGYFFQPTIFAEVQPDARIAQEEIFGPVLSVIPVDTWRRRSRS